MRFECDQGYVEVRFENYAGDAGCYCGNLPNERNCVELCLNFSLKRIGWGCVRDEYMMTSDIAALANGAAQICLAKADSFSHATMFLYEVLLKDRTFSRFRFCRRAEGIEVALRIWDGLCDYIEITQQLDETAFGELADELAAASRQFPER